MTAFLLQLWTIFEQGYVQLYFLFFVLINVFWWTRVWIARRNKDYTADFTGSCAVIVPVFREEAAVFEQCLRSIVEHGRPQQLIVTIDNARAADETVKQLAFTYADTVLYMPAQVGKREQFYQAAGRLQAVDVVLTVDSDTYWDETTMHILRPFSDPRVGAASGCQTIFDPTRTWVRRAAEWMEDMRFRVTLSFQSYFGQVNVIPGRTLAIRAELFKAIVVDTRHERVLGRRVITSDDASITMGVLERGYKSVYQSNSLVHTDAPDTYLRFWRQYLRWYRGSVRRILYKFPVLVRQHPLVFLANVEFNFGTFIYATILGSFLFKLYFRLYEILPISGFAVTESFNWRFVAILVGGFFASSYIRNLPHLLHYRRDVWFLPVFAIFTFVTMLPLKIVSLFSFFENGWMTRRQHNAVIREERVWQTRLIAAGTGTLILLAALPLPYLTDIYRLHLPFATILAREAPEYYRARAIAVHYQSSDGQATPANIRHLLERYSRRSQLPLHGTALQQASDCAEHALLHHAGQYTTDALTLFARCARQPQPAIAHRPTPGHIMPAHVNVLGPLRVQLRAGQPLAAAIRTQILRLDAERQLSLSQIAFVEYTMASRYSTTAARSGNTITIDLSVLDSLMMQSRYLTPIELQAAQQEVPAYASRS